MSKPYGRENRKAFLALADGTIFEGEGFGGKKQKDAPAVGEVVFNTSMYGYQEILTDPSYAGQIMTFTYPHIGNVGCNKEDVESKRIYVEGLIIRNESLIASNFRAEKSLSEYLELNSIMGLSRIDTRSLVQHIRDKGAQMGAMACCERREVDTLVDFARANGSMLGKDYVFAVTCEKPYSWEELPWTSGEMHSQKISQARLSGRPHLIALDCGIKFNILRILTECGFRVTVVPAGFTSAEIMELRPDALFLSNGPGDPAALQHIVQNVSGLVGRVPIFGICLGHQILGQVFGGKTYKLKFGHRGGNHPVMNLGSKEVEITVQNHGFAVEKESLPGDIRISHINLNDHTIEGLEMPAYKTFSVQYHPEASPGPHDSRYLFRKFYELVVG